MQPVPQLLSASIGVGWLGRWLTLRELVVTEKNDVKGSIYVLR